MAGGCVFGFCSASATRDIFVGFVGGVSEDFPGCIF
jgi:hypothetical protein